MAETNYTILVDAQIQNLQDIQKQLNSVRQTIDVDVNSSGLQQATDQTQKLSEATKQAEQSAADLILT